MSKLRVLVTAGGTQVPIDDVRYIANFSKGKYGLALARAFARRGCEVTLLGSTSIVSEALRQGREDDPQARGAGPAYIAYDTFDQFRTKLFEQVGVGRYDIVAMAAAVSDWLVADAAQGKIDSTADELTLRLKRAPKLIAELRERCGRKTFIVGFKLLSGAPREELLGKAKKQLETNHLNLVVANDLRQITGDRHPVTFVTPEGGAIDVTGSKTETSAQLADFVLKRQAVRWTPSRQMLGGGTQVESCHPGQMEALGLITFARSARAFSGKDGNLSARISPAGDMVVTPRGVDKRNVNMMELVYAKYLPSEAEVKCFGPRKSSIDTVVQATLYRSLTHIGSLLHVHPDAGLFLTDAVTTYPYPCGTLEEADEVLAALRSAKTAGSFCVELVHHGYLIGLEAGGPERMRGEWEKARSAYLQHLREVGQEHQIPLLTCRPIYASASVAGVIATHEGNGCVSSFLLPEHRKGENGYRVAKALDRLGKTAMVHDECEVLTWYCSHGWRVDRRDGSFAYLTPPSKRTDLRISATVALVEPKTRRVLLGFRKTEPFLGKWCFPGGKAEPEDRGDVWATARREYVQETGIALPPAQPIHARHPGLVGTPDGVNAYSVTNFEIHVDAVPAHHETDEIAPHLHDIDHALTLPMGRATRHLLRQIKKALDAARPRVAVAVEPER